MKFTTFMALTLFVLATSSAVSADNVLTEQEKKEGWVLLFDGQSTKGWMSPKERP